MKSGKKINSYIPSYVFAASFCIYGAGVVAASVYTAIKSLYNKTPLFFLVSDAAEEKVDENPLEIDGFPVKRISEWREHYQNTYPMYYLVAAPEIHHLSITESLRSMHVEDSRIYLLTGELENQIMEEYYSRRLDCNTISKFFKTVGENSCEMGLNVRQGDKLAFDRSSGIQVFQAKSHVDLSLCHPLPDPSYIEPIQVGAALTDRVISELQDNIGENISIKNRNYCELTATYYAWKSSRAAHKGICHYRRIFDISEEQMQILLGHKAKWDVILPYPTIHYPNIISQHTRYLKEGDWDAMLCALKEEEPAYFEAYKQMLGDGEKFFYNFNILIARAEVFDDYCSFLFRVLERAEALVTPKGWERADRFAGYMGENLTTIYFHKNRGNLKILYAGKKWLT